MGFTMTETEKPAVKKPKISEIIRNLLEQNPDITLDEVKDEVKKVNPEAKDDSIKSIYYLIKKKAEKVEETQKPEEGEKEEIQIVSEEKISISGEAVTKAIFTFANIMLDRLTKNDKIPFGYDPLEDDEIDNLVELWAPVIDQYLQTEETKLSVAVVITISMFISHIKPKVEIEIKEGTT